MLRNDTICALSTPSGMGAIAVIRVSGIDTFTLVSQVFKPLNKKKTIANVESHTAVFGNIYDGDDLIDEVLISVFRNPKSFTG